LGGKSALHRQEKNEAGRTPAMLAAMSGHVPILAALRRAGVDLGAGECLRLARESHQQAAARFLESECPGEDPV